MSHSFIAPHNFPFIRDDKYPPNLLVGAGMSFGLAPSPEKLKENFTLAENILGVSTTASTLGEITLYEWADEVLSLLAQKGIANPKLKLAQALGLTRNENWHCINSRSVNRATPRHRVIARLAREGCWGSIWTFNWDCLIESALESIGMEREKSDPQQPWLTGYHTFVTVADYINNNKSCVTIYKPHGCAHSLMHAEEAERQGNNAAAIKIANRFLIGASELENIANPNDPDFINFNATMQTLLSAKPLICTGWSAQERYILQFFENKKDLLCQYTESDRLSIIAPTFRKAHEELANIFNITKEQCHFPICRKNGEPYSADWLFLWIQTILGLEVLCNRSSGSSKLELDSLLKKEKALQNSSFVAKWFDCFLPAWVRLCWRAGLVSTTLTNGLSVLPHHIRMEKRDEHIPWRLNGIRPELEAAGAILVAGKKALPDWDMEKYPGAFWNPENMELRIPIPAWQAPDVHNALASLKPLLEEVRRNAGYLRKIALIPVPLADNRPSASLIAHYKSLVGRFLPISQFSLGTNINTISLEELTGEST